MNSPKIKPLLPDFVRDYRSLSAFWPFIKEQASTYAERRQIIGTAFNPLVDQLESLDCMPSDAAISDVLKKFDAENVHVIWVKALERRSTDPEGAITIARTLLEAVMKRILDERGKKYMDKEDLPKLHGMVAVELNLAPNQHSEEAFRAILGGAMNLVNGIATLRNRLSDSHGRGGPLPVRPSARHANLAVNMAGTVAVFLIETHLNQLDEC